MQIRGLLFLAGGADGLGLISHTDATNSVVKVAHGSNVVCPAARTPNLGHWACNVTSVVDRGRPRRHQLHSRTVATSRQTVPHVAAANY